MNQKQSLGRWGEDIVARHYERRGFTILDRNWRCRAGEIDIVARKGRSVCCIEVKTRATLFFGQPEEAITAAKRRRLWVCAAEYLRQHPTRASVRIQVCSLFEDNHRISMRIYTDAER